MNVDDEPRDVHTLACAVWQSPDPAADCDCQPAFTAGGDTLVGRYEGYAPRRQAAS